MRSGTSDLTVFAKARALYERCPPWSVHPTASRAELPVVQRWYSENVFVVEPISHCTGALSCERDSDRLPTGPRARQNDKHKPSTLHVGVFVALDKSHGLENGDMGHTRTVWSRLEEISIVPSALKATDNTC